MRKNELIQGAEPLPEDQAITTALTAETQEMVDMGGHDMVVGIRNTDGVLYRRVTVEGLGPFLGVIEVLVAQGLVDELEDLDGMREGCDAIFARPR
jgi:hypothetical protein